MDDPHDMNNLVGRKFRFERRNDKLVPVKELPSTTFHPDGTITAGEDIYAGSFVSANSKSEVVNAIKLREDS